MCSTACWTWDARPTSASPELAGAGVSAPASLTRATRSRKLEAGGAKRLYVRDWLSVMGVRAWPPWFAKVAKPAKGGASPGDARNGLAAARVAHSRGGAYAR